MYLTPQMRELFSFLHIRPAIRFKASSPRAQNFASQRENALREACAREEAMHCQLIEAEGEEVLGYFANRGIAHFSVGSNFF